MLHDVGTVDVNLLRVESLLREQSHQTEAVVFLNGDVIVHDVIPCPRETAAGLLLSSIVLHVGIVEATSIGVHITLEVTLTIVGVVGREGGLEVQTLHDVELQVDVTQQTPGLALLVGILHDEQGVLLVRELELRTCCRAQGVLVTRLLVGLALCIVRNEEGVRTVSELNHVVVGIVLLGTSNVHAESGADDLVNLGVNTTLEVDAVFLIAFIDTLLTVVTDTEVIVH